MLRILIGICSGIISGMGIGGGAVLIPALIFLEGLDQQTAQGINLVYFLPTAVISLAVHLKKGNVAVKTALVIGLFGMAGAAFGAWLAMGLGGGLLRRLFGGFLLLIGGYEIYKGCTDRG